MAETIRTFIAFELPPAVKTILQDLQRDLRRLNIRARWVRPENIHLTLKFLGNINPGRIDKIGAAMAGVAAEFTPVSVSVRGIGVFPGMKRPRVIWVGLDGEIRSLLALQHRLVEKLDDSGFPKDKKPFKAHLTLGRIKQAANPAAIRQMIAAYAGLSSEEFTLNPAVLFKSDLKPSGAVYSILRQVNFGLTNPPPADECRIRGRTE